MIRDDNKFYKKINSQVKYKSTFEELTDQGLNHFEVAFLTMEHAKHMVRNGRNLISENESLKPKAAFVSLRELCEQPQEARQYMEEIINRAFNIDVEQDNYNNPYNFNFIEEDIEEDIKNVDDDDIEGEVERGNLENLDSLGKNDLD